MIPRASILTAILAVCLATPSVAQRYHVRTYTQGDGLASGVVHDIAQHPDGRLWFATRAGLSVWDGNTWENFHTDHGLPTADQWRVFCDASGAIWTVGARGLCAVGRDTTWHALAIPPEPVLSTNHLSAATLVSTLETQLLVIAGEEGGLYGVKPEGWQKIEVANLWDTVVYDMHSGDSLLYVASQTGAWKIPLGSHPLTATRVPGTDARPTHGIALDPAGGYWVAGPNFVQHVRHGTSVFEQHIQFPVLYRYISIAPDGHGGAFLANPQHSRYTSPAGSEILGLENGFHSSGASRTFRDRESSIWFPSLRGVARLTGLHFVNYDADTGLPADEVTAVLERRDGSYLLGHPIHVSAIKDGTVQTLLELESGPEVRVLDLAEEGDGSVWAAVSALGLYRLATDGTVRRFDLENVPQAGATSVFVSTAGDVFVAAHYSVHRRAENEEFEQLYRLSRNTQGSTAYVRRFFEGIDGTIYVAFNHGLGIISGGEITVVSAERAGMANNVYALHQARDGTLWVGTAGGVAHVRGNHLVPAQEPALLGPVYFIVPDNEERLWFGTDNGVVSWDGARQRRFTIEDGLAGRETNRAAGIRDSRGQLWFGTDRGVTIYRPWHHHPINTAPIVSLLEMDTGARTFSLSENVAAQQQNTLTFRYRSLWLRDEHRIHTQARLEGFDEDWIDAGSGTVGEVRYTNLPPGDYAFELRASTNEGVWSTPIRSAAIHVARPFHRSPGFFGLIALVGVLLTIGAIEIVLRRRAAARLEREVAERVSELGAVRDELDRARRIESIGALAGGVAHDFNNLLAVLIGNLSLLKMGNSLKPDERQGVDDALAAGRRATALARQLLTFARGGAPHREPGRIQDVIRESASFILSGSNVSCAVDIEPALYTLDIDADQISQVMNNLLINAQQAMPGGGTVTIRGRNHAITPHASLAAGRYAEITVTDTGTGIPPQNLERVFEPYFSTRATGSGLGLATAYSIINRHDGLLAVESLVGDGTTFRIYLPASNNKTVERLQAESTTVSPAPVRMGRVLVMDDEPGVRDVIERTLRMAGYRVSATAEGNAAVAAYASRMGSSEPFDFVVMDLTVPGGMGGKDAMEKLLRVDPDVRAIVASGYSEDPAMANWQQYGFIGRLAKPFSPQELLDCVARATEQRRQRPRKR